MRDEIARIDAQKRDVKRTQDKEGKQQEKLTFSDDEEARISGNHLRTCGRDEFWKMQRKLTRCETPFS